MFVNHMVQNIRKKNGCFGWVSNFSFYYAHHLSTIEEAWYAQMTMKLINIKIFRGHGC